MSEEISSPWWRNLLTALALLLGVLATAGVLTAIIVALAQYWNQAEHSPVADSPPVSTESVPQNTALTRVPSAYAPVEWPSSPVRGGFQRGGGSGGGLRSSGTAHRAVGPVGVSVDEYRAAVAAGNKVFLPDPKGECNLSGAEGPASVNGLDSCFASQVAR